MNEGKLDRDSLYRIAALHAAVARAGQDGGLSNQEVDVLAIAEVYLGWMSGKAETVKPKPERNSREKPNE